MNISEKIHEVVQVLPEEQANMVLMFAQFLRQQSQPVISTMTPEPQSADSWSMLVAELAGSWPDFPSLGDLRADLGRGVLRETL